MWIKDVIEYLSSIFKWWVIVQPWEQGLKVRLGKSIKILEKGIYFRIPYMDSIYVQPIRLRVVQNPLQTLTTKDGKTLSIACVVGYSIVDIMKFYNSLHQPESTISNMTLGGINDYISKRNCSEVDPIVIEEDLVKEFAKLDYGIKFEYVKIIGFANVKTYRLIQDSTWMPDSLSLDIKK